MHKEEKLSFKNVITFNLDEYLDMNPNSIHSYNRFMYDNLFNHIDIKRKNIHIPKGNIYGPDIEKHCIKLPLIVLFEYIKSPLILLKTTSLISIKFPLNSFT